MLGAVSGSSSTIKILLGVIVAMVMTAGACRPARAAGAVGSDPEQRAALFQAEARKIFARDRWKIVREGSGGFTAVHTAESGGTTSSEEADKSSSPLLVHVSITFRPRSVDSTDCAVKIEGFRLNPQGAGRSAKLSGPYKADYPANTDYIRKVLETAEDRLGKKYPKFQAK